MNCQSDLERVIQQALDEAKHNGADAAEVHVGVDVGFAVTARASDVESLEHENSREFSVTIYHDQRTASASSTDLASTAIKAAVEKACTIAKYAEQDEYTGLAEAGELAYDYPTLDLYHHWPLTPKTAIEKAIAAEQYALALDQRLTQSEGVSISAYDSYHAYGNSHGFMGYYPESSHSFSCAMIAESKKGMQRDYAYTSSRHPADLEDFNAVATRAVENTLQRLDAVKIKTQTCPVLFVPRLAKRLWATLISAISGPNIYRQTSFLCEQMDQAILPAFITIGQRPHIFGAMGSAPYDNDGVKTRDLNYVEDGQLKSYVLGSYSARKLGLKTTGNAGGVFNLAVTYGDDDFAALLKKMHKGLVVVELLGHGVNIVNGNYSRAAVGLWVEDGKIQHAVHEVTIAGNLSEMFKHIVAVGNDVDARGNIHTGSVLIEKMTIAGA